MRRLYYITMLVLFWLAIILPWFGDDNRAGHSLGWFVALLWFLLAMHLEDLLDKKGE